MLVEKFLLLFVGHASTGVTVQLTKPGVLTTTTRSASIIDNIQYIETVLDY